MDGARSQGRRADQPALADQAGLNRLLQLLPDGALVTDRSGIVCAWNPAAENLFSGLDRPLGLPIKKILSLSTAEYKRLRKDPNEQIQRNIGSPGAERRYLQCRVLQGVAADTDVVLLRDISGERRTQEAAARGEHWLHLAQMAAGIGTWDWNVKSDVVHCSDNYLGMFGLPLQDGPIPREELFLRIHPKDRDRVRLDVDVSMRSREDYRSEYRVVRGDDSVRWVQSRGRVLFDENGEVSRMIGAVFDVTDRREREKRLEELARSDSLTGLPNRLALTESLERCLARARRAGSSVSLLYLDLDNFKEINDAHGHAVGDALLQEVGRRLESTVRRGDSIARLGGDEFAIVQPDGDEVSETVALARRVVKSLGRPYAFKSLKIAGSVSVGISQCIRQQFDSEEMLRQADAALYKAKGAGGGAFRFYSDEIDRVAQARAELLEDLEGAWDRDEFYLEYQPQVRLSDRQTVGFEALLRWQHPRRGLISPREFIGPAEDSGLIVPLGRWVVAEACRQARTWHDAGRDEIGVSVNISPVQMTDPDFLATVRTALSNNDLAPQAIDLELTESALTPDNRTARETLEQLHEDGTRISVDAFGSGRSSLWCLTALPVNRIKVARDLTVQADQSQEESAVLEAVVGLGHKLGLTVLAEGVERGEEANRLARLGCDEAQGYYFGRPAPADQALPV